MGHGVAAKPTVRYDAVAPESDERHLEELIKDYINMLPRLLALGMLALLLTACDSSFSPPSQINEELAARYKQLSCSVVLVLSAHERGTGFFIDSDGTLMTAAHVLFDETWTADSDKPSLRLSSKHNLRVVFTDERIVPLQVDDSDSVTIKNAGFDLAMVKVSVSPTGCYFSHLDLSYDLPAIAEHLIAIGYPSQSPIPSQVLYDGFMSSIYHAEKTPSLEN